MANDHPAEKERKGTAVPLHTLSARCPLQLIGFCFRLRFRSRGSGGLVQADRWKLIEGLWHTGGGKIRRA
ncbi:hypothetical protein ZHAS_00021497 [Anopheles sinensis]|uniref:Uncharacterized protein n=1 Tax=Anopheles sinensis TaxID=74873 RepID=A0A084WSJ8_ANOSI|nr:hypothetical protein ZHAS_00021497 [Anopheles sinensis]